MNLKVVKVKAAEKSTIVSMEVEIVNSSEAIAIIPKFHRGMDFAGMQTKNGEQQRGDIIWIPTVASLTREAFVTLRPGDKHFEKIEVERSLGADGVITRYQNIEYGPTHAPLYFMVGLLPIPHDTKIQDVNREIGVRELFEIKSLLKQKVSSNLVNISSPQQPAVQKKKPAQKK